MNNRLILCLFIVISFACSAWSQSTFTIIPLGVKGGSDESNLSAYALAVEGTNEFVCLDAGTVNYGIQKAISAGLLQGSTTDVIRNNIKGYLLSHPHLDHVAGLIINSPDDSAKPIYGLPFCLEVLKENYFTWKSWANFANEGEKPLLNKYHYTPLSAGVENPLENTTMHVKAFALSHSAPGQSTAFLIRQNDAYILYLGDTGADEIEKSTNLKSLWSYVGPLIKSRKLKALFIEVSFSNEQPDKLLFGHLTPRLLMNELKNLADNAGGSLKDFPVVITHMKPSGDREEKIKKQLNELNTLQVKLIFAEQAHKLEF